MRTNHVEALYLRPPFESIFRKLAIDGHSLGVAILFGSVELRTQDANLKDRKIK